jgi:hypothetical protein
MRLAESTQHNFSSIIVNNYGMEETNIFSSLQSSSLAILLDGSRFIAMGVQIVHLIALTFLLALVLAVNIRVLRLSLRSLPVDAFAAALVRPFLITLAVAVIAGILLFLPRAETYAGNVPFLWKMSLLLIAGVGQFLLLRHLAALRDREEPALPVRSCSLVMLALWLGTGVAGRAIGFV